MNPSVVHALLCAFVIAVGTATLWVLPSTGRPTLPFGVRVPPSHVAAPVILRTLHRYRLLVLYLGLGTGVGALLLWPLLPYGSVATASALAVGCGGAVAYLRGRRLIARAKADEGWYRGLREGVAVDTGLRTDPVRLPWRWALPSFLLIAATAVTGAVLYPGLPARLVVSVDYGSAGRVTEHTAATTVWSAFALPAVQLAITLGVLAILAAGLRARADIDAARPVASSLRHRRTLEFTTRAGLGMLVVLNAALGGLALLVWTGSMADRLLAATVVVPAALGGPALVGLLVAARFIAAAKDPAPGAEEPTGLVQRDDDRYWHVGGLVYANRADPVFLVPKRMGGSGWTVNLGHPGAWGGLAVLVLLVGGTAAADLAGLMAENDGFSGWGWQFDAGR